MSYTVTVLARARQDVQQIYDWLAERSPDGAVRWLESFEKAMHILENNPFIAPLAPEDRFFDYEIRHILFRTRRGRPYRAVFAVMADQVRILRVRGPGQRPLRTDDVTL